MPRKPVPKLPKSLDVTIETPKSTPPANRHSWTPEEARSASTHRMTPDQKVYVIEQLMSGASQKDLAEEIGFSDTAIRTLFRNWLATPAGRETEERLQQLRINIVTRHFENAAHADRIANKAEKKGKEREATDAIAESRQSINAAGSYLGIDPAKKITLGGTVHLTAQAIAAMSDEEINAIALQLEAGEEES